MRKSNFALRLQPSLLDEARKLAEEEGVALNQLINVAVAEKLRRFARKPISSSVLRAPICRRHFAFLKRAGIGRRPVEGDELSGPKYK